MRYIEKHFETPEVQKHNEELRNLQLDETSLLNPEVYPGLTGSQLYDIVRDMETLTPLKQQMFKEQGGVCCYCGMKLDYPFDPQHRLEHVSPKEKHRELVGEYKNLLLSCRANKSEVELRDKAAKKERKKLIHCDEAKGSAEISYSPLKKTCESAFIYTIDGEIHPKDELAEKDIKTLGLDGPYLTTRRKKAIESLVIGEDVLSEEELIAFKSGLQLRDAKGCYEEFYFVLIDAINQLLPVG